MPSNKEFDGITLIADSIRHELYIENERNAFDHSCGTMHGIAWNEEEIKPSTQRSTPYVYEYMYRCCNLGNRILAIYSIPCIP